MKTLTKAVLGVFALAAVAIVDNAFDQAGESRRAEIDAYVKSEVQKTDPNQDNGERSPYIRNF